MKYRTRLVIYYLLASILTMLLVGLGVAKSIQYWGMQAIEEDLIAQSESAMVYTSQTLHLKRRGGNPLTTQTARMITDRLSAGHRQVRIYDQNAHLLSASLDGITQKDPQTRGGKEHLTAALQGDYSYVVLADQVYFAAPIIFNGEIIGVLEFVHPLALLHQIFAAVTRVLFMGGLVFSLLITLLTLIITSQMMRPVNRLIAATRRYAQRDFTPVGIHGTDEFSQLGRRLNYMGSQLKEYIERQKQFVTNISHELQEPLNAIQGYADLIQHEAYGKPELEKAVRHLKKESERLGSMVDGLLFLSRVDARDELFLTRLNFSELVFDTIHRLELRASKLKITVLTRIEPDLYVAGDEEKLFQVLINLLDNAIKFSPSPGQVEVELFGQKSNLQLKILDRGPGIPEGEVAKVFERFYRASNAPKVGGTGLGLAIAREMVMAHAGTIQLSQRPGGGTVVTVLMPLLKKTKN